MELTRPERELADGSHGEVVAGLIREQVTVGEFFGAERLVPISNAHVMGDLEVLGDSGLGYLRRLADAGQQAAVPTTRNAQSVDFDHALALSQAPRLIEGEREVRALLGRLGIAAVNTCIGYQSVYQPRTGEHVAWGDTGTVAYANSVLGARTNYESGAAGFAAAITGRTPAYGFHLDEHRRANVVVRVEAELPDVAHWGALGAVVGELARGYWNVPVLDLGARRPSSDELKHLGAALASYGSLAMYHIAGVTPEAPDLETAIGGRDVIDDVVITDDHLHEVFGRHLGDGADVDVVVFSGPQLSLFELSTLAEKFGDRPVAPTVKAIATSSTTVCAGGEDAGVIPRLVDAGVLVLRGTCWYVMDPAAQRETFGWSRLATNSAKLANIVRAHGYQPALRPTRDCVEAAVTGRLAAL